MSRWVEYFNSHAFQQVWKTIVEESNKLEVSGVTLAEVQELAHFKKVIKYLDGLLSACDPDLVPKGVWDSFDGYSKKCLAGIAEFNQNQDIVHLQNSNGTLDELLTCIRPYVVSSNSAAQAAARAFKVYSDTIIQEMNNFRELVKSDVTEIKTNLVNSNAIYSSIGDIKTQIEQFNADIFTDKENIDSFETKTTKLLQEVVASHDEVKKYHDILLVDVNGQDSLKRLTEGAIKNIDDGKNSVIETLSDIELRLTDFRKFYSDTFGSKNENTGEFEVGLKKELTDCRTKYKALLDEIESLLPGATSAGLASAYGDLKKSFDQTITRNTIIFYGAIAAVVITSLITIASEVGLFYIKLVDVTDIKFLYNFLYKLPLVIPVVWLAAFASKRRSEAQRLKQEYAHKEAITKSYQSFKKQVDDLGVGNEELMKKLLDTAILAVAYNASETLDKKHGDKMPIHEVVESVITKIQQTRT